ncbi:MAG: DbpA RNA binding domain-containing protein, partial [Prevotella sp.]|nr:DbpA RNA binding domain-containing protein [Prevotella sp.]
RFLDYYADAPEILRPDDSKKKSERSKEGGKREKDGRGGRKREAEKGYARLFINLGKNDGFFPGEIMQYLNKHIKEGKQQVGHIDLFGTFSYIEVPTRDANKVMKALNGTVYKGREVRCNEADSPVDKNGKHAEAPRSSRKEKREKDEWVSRKQKKKVDWRDLIQGQPFKNKGKDAMDLEDGWARRRPKKK